MMDDGASGGALRSATVEGRTSKPADNFRWLARDPCGRAEATTEPE
jgi:hypothetical protein